MNNVKIGIIGGSGLGAALALETSAQRHQIITPFGTPSDAVVETVWSGIPIFLLSRHGSGHLFNPSTVNYRANIFALKQLGCTHVIATGAVGSLREEFAPRQLVIPDQIIDKTFKRANTFYENAAVHVELAEPFCPVLRKILHHADETAHRRGCYVAMEGPAFSTRAESLMHRLWGGDLIGMTAMPEAKLAREAELAYALVALVTDYDCWRGKSQSEVNMSKLGADAYADPSILLKEIIANLQAATDRAVALIRKAVEMIADKSDEAMVSPAHRALELAIWSDKKQIARDEVEKLGPLWGKYFG